jgi:hypothetical protein
MLAVEDPEQQVADIRSRIAVIDGELLPMRAYVSSGCVAHLNGLGLDDLIAQAYPDRVGAEVTA